MHHKGTKIKKSCEGSPISQDRLFDLQVCIPSIHMYLVKGKGHDYSHKPIKLLTGRRIRHKKCDESLPLCSPDTLLDENAIDYQPLNIPHALKVSHTK